MKQALVCTICEEVSWIFVKPLHVSDRRWWICTECYEGPDLKIVSNTSQSILNFEMEE